MVKEITIKKLIKKLHAKNVIILGSMVVKTNIFVLVLNVRQLLQ
jgi:hypothetical protein